MLSVEICRIDVLHMTVMNEASRVKIEIRMSNEQIAGEDNDVIQSDVDLYMTCMSDDSMRREENIFCCF